MTNFIENVNQYINHMKIKQTYISMKSDINTSTLSRILNGSRDITITEMERISKALGKTAAFFLDDNFTLPSIPTASSTAVLYAGEPNKAQEKFALQLIEMLENADEIIGARARFMMDIGE